MSLLDRIRRIGGLERSRYVPVVVGGQELGFVAPKLAAWLFESGLEVTRDGSGRVVLAEETARAEERSARLRPLWESLRAAGRIPAWRGEELAIYAHGSTEPLLHMERGAVDVMGLPAQGTHLNGYVLTPAGLEVWVARRARDKPTFPGLLDHLAAGGLLAGLAPRANMAKEAAEEAGISAELFAAATPGPTLRYACALPWGVRQDTLHTFDLLLPADWQPHAADGEVAAFERWPLARVLATLRDSRAFKFNVPPVLLASLIDRGALAEDPEQMAVASALDAVRVDA